MSKQKTSGGQSRQSATESGSKAGPVDTKGEQRGKEANSNAKAGEKGGGARQKRKH